MKTVTAIISSVALSLCAGVSMADSTKDCMLEGTVQKGANSQNEQLSVKFHSAEKYDQDSNCRIRRGEKLEFKLPDDPRLKDAEAGSPVKYRYRTDSDGSSKTELVSVGT